MTIQTQPYQPSQPSDLALIKGHQTPRIWTPPKVDLTKRENSYGYNVIDFGKLIGLPLDPWQEWLVIQIGELSLELDDKGNRVPQKDRVVLLVARQNGKTLLVELLSLYWMFVERHKSIYGMNATLTDALKVMQELSEFAHASDILRPLILKTKEGNTDPSFQTREGSIYRPVAANERGGRGSRIQRAIIDETRLHKDWKAYNAIIPAMSAQKNRQAIFLTNAGYDDSIVLNSLRKSALDYIETGTGDEHLGIYEWSAPDTANIYDPQTWAYANPSLGLRKSHNAMKSEADTAKTGSTEEANFKTEHLCMHVKAYDAAIDAAKWSESFVEELDWSSTSRASAMFLDVAWSQNRATLAVSYVRPDGKSQLGVFQEWRDANAMAQLESDLPAILAENKPRAFGWMSGPAASKSFLKQLKVPGVQIEQLKGDVPTACMTFTDLVRDGMIVHGSPSNDLLTVQVTSAAKKQREDGQFTFTRSGVSDCDAVYASAGAVLLARSLPPLQPLRYISPDDGEEDE